MRNANYAGSMQFVNFTQIMSRPIPASKKEAEFALSALMEIPEQFKAAMNLQLLGYFSCQTHTNFWNFGSSVFFPVALISIDLYLVSWAEDEGDFQTDRYCLRL
jgi:hypothetical protein